jgi:hypothetical protein
LIATESFDVQFELMRLVRDAHCGRHAHKVHEGCVSFSSRHLRKRFGRGVFPSLNGRHALFDVSSNWSKAHRTTRAYRLKPYIAAALDLATSGELVGLGIVDARGRALIKAPAHAIASRNVDGRRSRAWKGLSATVPSSTPINTHGLRELIADMDRIAGHQKHHADITPAGAVQLRREAADLLAHTGRDGRLIQTYVPARNGRLVAPGGQVHLQNVRKRVRWAAHPQGSWDIDIVSCHPTALAQLCDPLGIACPNIITYNADPSGTRNGIVERTGLPYKLVKKCLIALTYGASRIKSPRAAIAGYLTPPITKDLGEDSARAIGRARAERFFSDQIVSALADDYETVLDELPRRWRWRRGTLLVNDAGCEVDPRGLPPRKLLAFFLQGAEAAMLRAMLVGAELGPHVLVLQHDGLTVVGQPNASRIERVILDRTGYKVKIKAEEVHRGA